METVLEDYRELYPESMPAPYLVLGMLIEGIGEVHVPDNRVLALPGDERINRQALPEAEAIANDSSAYRCENCGSIVNEHAVMLEGSEQALAISLLCQRDGRGAIPVQGECCQP